MPSAAQAVQIYRELADWHQRQGQPQQRDRFLVLAADAALAAGQDDEAERLRLRLLQLNPHHLLKPYASFAEATRAGDVLSYLTALRQSHPWEAAERLLATLQPDAPDRPTKHSEPEPELQVFRVRPEAEQPRPDPPRPRQAPPPHARTPQQAVPVAQPVVPAKPRGNPPPRAVPRTNTFAPEPEPQPLPARRSRMADLEEPAASGGNVLPALLFTVLLAAAVGLAFWTLVRPFFPL
jgi:hypothetical protein